MNLSNVVMKSSLLTAGCKFYYSYLIKINEASRRNNWKIIDGQYKDHNFVIVKDKETAATLKIGTASITNYKRQLKSLGLISILKKFTTRTNQVKNKHFYQITVVHNNIPRKFISKTLTFNGNIKKPTIRKTNNNILARIKLKINNFKINTRNKIKNTVNKVNNLKHNNQINTDDPTIKIIKDMLGSYNVRYKFKDLNKYKQLYESSPQKFKYVCEACSNAFMYAPFSYFSKVFEKYEKNYKYKNPFINFTQRNYDFDALEERLFGYSTKNHGYKYNFEELENL